MYLDTEIRALDTEGNSPAAKNNRAIENLLTTVKLRVIDEIGGR